MKISVIVKQTKEYERLSRLIEDIEKAIKDFDKINKVESNVIYANGTLTLAGGLIHGLPPQPTERQVDVFLNSDIAKLVRDDVKVVLKKHLARFKKQRNALEV